MLVHGKVYYLLDARKHNIDSYNKLSLNLELISNNYPVLN